MANSLIDPDDAFDKFMKSTKTKFDKLDGIHKPLNYVGQLYEHIREYNQEEKNNYILDKEIFNRYIKDCNNTNDEEIFSHLYTLAEYLVMVIKKIAVKIRINRRQEHVVQMEVVKDELDFAEPLSTPTTRNAKKNESRKNKMAAINENRVANIRTGKFEIIDEEVQKKLDELEEETDELEEETVELEEETDELEEETDELEEETHELEEETKELEEGTEDDKLTEHDLKILKKMEKYDNFCQKISLKIEEGEKEELTFDELESSESKYLIDSILKKRFHVVYKKLRKICKENPHLVEGGMPKKTTNEFGRPISVKKAKHKEINDLITLKLEKSRQFPDYFDVLEWVTEANTKSKLNLNKERIEDQAKESFQEIGRILKNRRKKDMESLFENRLEGSDEPKYEELNKDADLMKKLSLNKNIAVENEKKVIDEFAEKEQKNEIPEENSATSESETEDEIKTDENKIVDDSDNDDANSVSSQASDHSSDHQENMSEDGFGESKSKTQKRVIDLDDDSELDLPVKKNLNYVPELNGTPKKKAKLEQLNTRINNNDKEKSNSDENQNKMGLNIVSISSLADSPVKDVKPTIKELEKLSSTKEKTNVDEGDDCIVLD